MKRRWQNRRINELTARVAFVTRDTGWLGISISEALTQAGATVAIVDCDAESVDKTVMEQNVLVDSGCAAR